MPSEPVLLSNTGAQRPAGPEGWLPRWLPATTTSGGVLRSLCDWWVEATDPERAWAERLLSRQWLTTVPLGEERLRWQARLPFQPGEELRVRFLCVAGSGEVTHARSPYDYQQYTLPVWWSDPTSRILELRGLHLRETSATSSGGVYTISGEPEGLVPDGDLFWRRPADPHWQRVAAETGVVSGSNVRLPVTGQITLRYPSQYYARTLASGSLTLERSGASSLQLPLCELRPENVFDGYGQLLGLSRLSEETNGPYRERMLALLSAPPDSSIPGVARGVAASLGLLSLRYWNGIQDLLLDPTGASGYTFAYLPELAPLRELEEPLAPLSGGLQTRFRATLGGWRDGWLVLVDGIPRAGTSVSGNLVTLATATSGEVLARYSVQQYSLEATPRGTIGTLRAGTGIASGSYLLLLVRNVRPESPDLPQFRDERLISAAGLPNGLFLELASRLGASNASAWGRAYWGAAAVWHLRREEAAPPAHLALPFDPER